MASREFLKTMKEARLGDVFSQQRLGEIYLNGDAGTPKQPANALIWLEKAFSGFKQAGLSDQFDSVINLAKQLPLYEVLSSPAAEFAWQCFSEAAKQGDLDAKWQIGKTLLECDGSPITNMLVSKFVEQFFPGMGMREQAIIFLEEVANSDSPKASEAAELIDAKRPTTEKINLLWNEWLSSKDKNALTAAAELGYAPAQLTLGLQLAKLVDENRNGKPSANDSSGTGSASLKKAVQWLTLAAKQGERDAWFNLALIYRRPQFSGYNAEESDRCIDQAADLGHPEAQFRKGSLLWRRRARLSSESIGSELPELRASYWVWQAAQQGVQDAIEMLPKMLDRAPKADENLWHDLAKLAAKALDKGAQIRLPGEWVPLCHRIVVGNQFSLTKAEMLLVDIPKMQHEHCVVVDVREHLAKAHPRLIQIDTLEQRKSLLLASKVFSSDSEASTRISLLDEGNLRQRRYRFEKLSDWLVKNFT